MNTKVTNVIAVELAILIAILAWMAFSNLSRVKQPAAAEEQQGADYSLATVTSVPKAGNQRYYAADYPAGPYGGQLGAQQQTQTLQYDTMQYDQQLAPAPDSGAYLDDSLSPGTSPDYADAYPQAETAPDSIGWPYDPVLAYPPTSEIIVFSNGQRFVRRGAPRFVRPRMTVVHRSPLGGGLHTRGGGMIPRSTANPRSFRPSAGLRAR